MPGGPAALFFRTMGLPCAAISFPFLFTPSSTEPAAIFNPGESSRQLMPHGLFVPDVLRGTSAAPRRCRSGALCPSLPPCEEGFPRPRPWHSPHDMLGRGSRVGNRPRPPPWALVMAKRRRAYQPRVFITADEIEQIHKEVPSSSASRPSPMIEEPWPELVHNLPPKRLQG
jgi:hypothetical protein